MQRIRFDNNFDPKSTFTCGQVFRYFLKNDSYSVIAGDKECTIRHDDAGYYIDTKEETFFRNYFDIDRNYDIILERVKADDKLAKIANYGRGIRILNQNPLETIISFIISANNNIPRIKQIIERLCSSLGDYKDGFYAFPSLDALASEGKNFFLDLGAGYRADYLANTSKALKNFDFNFLNNLDTASLRNELLKLKGVGRKVADCILLFGFHRTDVFPVDTWIKKVFSHKYGNISAIKMSEELVKSYGCDSGYVQQYLFYYARNNIFEELSWQKNMFV